MPAPHAPDAATCGDGSTADADGLLGAGALVLAGMAALAAEAGSSCRAPSVSPKKAAMKIALIVNGWGPKTSPSR
jgi:hypothetical protein